LRLPRLSLSYLLLGYDIEVILVSNWCFNWLTVRGQPYAIKRFKDGLQVGNKRLLLESYLPCPQKLVEANHYGQNIGYETFFNPDPSGYLKVLELPKIENQGIKNREQLMEFVKREHPDGCGDPDSYEEGLKINNNLFEFGFKNWYDWCLANWGTKWIISPDEKSEDSDHVLEEVSDTKLIFKFRSAWNPPGAGIDRIAALFPELDFKLEFAEPCNGFRGCGHLVDGRLVERERGVL